MHLSAPWFSQCYHMTPGPLGNNTSEEPDEGIPGSCTQKPDVLSGRSQLGPTQVASLTARRPLKVQHTAESVCT